MSASAAKNDFSKGSVRKLILTQGVPLMIAQLVHLLYSVVDRIYLGHMSAADNIALTGVGLVLPIVSLVGAFTNLFASGGAPLFAIARGARQEERASRLQSNVFALLTGCSLVLMAVTYAFRRPILYLFGASDASWPYANSYLVIYLLGTPFTMLATGLNGFINAQGFPKVGMMTTLLGAALNLLLDPLFIFAFGMGVRGAAWATVISQFVSCAWVLRFLTGKKAVFPLRRDHMRIRWPMLKEILALGVVGFIMNATNSLVQAVCNAMLTAWGGVSGDLYIGVMTIVTSVREILHLPVSGITSGAQPVLGYNFGAKQNGRVRDGIRFLTALGLIYTVSTWLSAMLLPGFFVSIFSSDPAMKEIGSHALRMYLGAFFCQTFQMCGQSVFQAIGDAKHAIFFSLLRKVIIVLPLTLLLPGFGFGTDGVFFAEPVSNVLGGLACYITMMLTVYRRLGRKENRRADT